MPKATHRRKGLCRAHDSRKIRGPRHHGLKVWHQAPGVIAGSAENTHPEPQAGNRERERGIMRDRERTKIDVSP